MPIYFIVFTLRAMQYSCRVVFCRVVPCRVVNAPGAGSSCHGRRVAAHQKALLLVGWRGASLPARLGCFSFNLLLPGTITQRNVLQPISASDIQPTSRYKPTSDKTGFSWLESQLI